MKKRVHLNVQTGRKKVTCLSAFDFAFDKGLSKLDFICHIWFVGKP